MSWSARKCDECGVWNPLLSPPGRYGTGQYAQKFYCTPCWESYMRTDPRAFPSEASIEIHGIEHSSDPSNPYWCPHCQMHLNKGNLAPHLRSPNHRKKMLGQGQNIQNSETSSASKSCAENPCELVPRGATRKRSAENDLARVERENALRRAETWPRRPLGSDRVLHSKGPRQEDKCHMNSKLNVECLQSDTKKAKVESESATTSPQAERLPCRPFGSDQVLHGQGLRREDKSSMSLKVESETLPSESSRVSEVIILDDDSHKDLTSRATPKASGEAAAPPTVVRSGNDSGSSNTSSSATSSSSTSWSSTSFSSTSSHIETCWEFKLSDNSSADDWQPFQATAGQEIERAYASLQGSNPQDGDGKLNLSTNGFTYSIDFTTMTQQNVQSGRCRRIRRSQRPSKDALQKLEVQDKRLKEVLESKEKLGAELNSALQDLEVKDKKLKEVYKANENLSAELLTAKAHIRALMSVDLKRESQLENAKDEVRKLDKLLDDEIKQHLHQEESWRLQHQHADPCVPFGVPCLKRVEELLRGTSHRGPYSRCHQMSEVQVLRVEKVNNVKLWGMYLQKREQMRRDLKDDGIEAVASLAPKEHSKTSKLFEDAFPWIKLDTGLNEVLLFHGTKCKNVSEITKVGFDARLSGREGWYGEGVYFAEESCKSWQYCTDTTAASEKCMILARVLIGDPYYAQGDMKSTKIPPRRDDQDISKGRHNSIVANVGTPRGTGFAFPPVPPALPTRAKAPQSHREYVVFDGHQAYPEFVIYFKV